LNHGIDLDYYTLYSQDLTGIEDLAIYFSTHQIHTHDLEVKLDIPQSGHIGVEIPISYIVTNWGLEHESDIEALLYIDGELVNTTTF